MTQPSKRIEDLVNRLNIKADIISTGERIQWGSDSAIMREAADVLTQQEAEKQQAVEFERGRIAGAYEKYCDHDIDLAEFEATLTTENNQK